MRKISQLLSIIFHPLTIPTYVLLILLWINPYIFGVNSAKDHLIFIFLVVISTLILPGLSVAMMLFTGLIKSIHSEDNRDRIGPFIAALIFYLWMYINFKSNPDVPLAYSFFILGSIIAMSLAFVINVFMKISLHTLAMGGVCAMALLIYYYFSYQTIGMQIPLLGSREVNIGILVIFIVLLSGIVGTARLFLKAHKPVEIYSGYILGFLSMMTAFKLVF